MVKCLIYLLPDDSSLARAEYLKNLLSGEDVSLVFGYFFSLLSPFCCLLGVAWGDFVRLLLCKRLSAASIAVWALNVLLSCWCCCTVSSAITDFVLQWDSFVCGCTMAQDLNLAGFLFYHMPYLVFWKILVPTYLGRRKGNNFRNRKSCLF